MRIPVEDVRETIEVSSPDKEPVRLAILGKLMTWLKAQKSAEEAHEVLTTTLKRIGLKFVAQLMNSNSLEILLKNLDLTPERKSSEQQSILRTESEPRESKVAEPNPICNSALPAPESVSTSVSIPNPECHIVPDSTLLSASVILESESALSSEPEPIVVCHQKAESKFSFDASHLFSEDMISNVELVYHQLQVKHSIPIIEPDRQNLSKLHTIHQSEADNQKLSEHAKQKLSEPDKQKLSEHDKQKLSEHKKQKLSEPDKQKLSEPDKQKVSKHKKQKLSELDKQKLSEYDKQKLSEHNKQILEQERIEKRLQELKRARLEREKLAKIALLQENAIKTKSKSETKVRVPQLVSWKSWSGRHEIMGTCRVGGGVIG